MRCIVALIVFYFFSCFMGWYLCDINPNDTYSWYFGIWHGLFFIPNWFRSWFGDAMYKANYYTTGYNVWWWITTFFSSVSFIIGGANYKYMR